MNIGICDVDKVWHERVKCILREYAEHTGLEMEMISFQSGKEVMEYRGFPMDVIFMDIQLESENGIDVAKHINRTWENCQVVYLTSSLDYVMDVYQTEHTFYVLKEQFPQWIGVVFDKIYRKQERERRQIVFAVAGEGKSLVLMPEEILYFERSGRVTYMETVWGQYMLHERLDVIMERLPQDSFVRCHNSYIVYLPAVKEFRRGSFQMNNGHDIMISRSHLQAAKKAFVRWSLAQPSSNGMKMQSEEPE